MIEEQATVISVDGRRVAVATSRQSSCGHCSARAGCGTSLLGKYFNRNQQPLVFETDMELAAGDTVVLGMEEGALVKGSLIVYALPLLFMILFPVLAGYATSSEFISIVTGIAGFVAGLWVVRGFSARVRNDRHYQPVLLRNAEGSQICASNCTAVQE